MIEKFDLVAFDSTHSAIRAEKELVSKGVKVKIIPVPREVTANCGISIKISMEDLILVKEILEDKNIETSGYYNVEKIGLNKKVKVI